MAWRDWNNEMPVQICGVTVTFPDDMPATPNLEDMEITFHEDGHGCEEFENLAVARLFFPDLDPEHSGPRFTWACRGELDGQPAIRFETRAAERMYSR